MFLGFWNIKHDEYLPEKGKYWIIPGNIIGFLLAFSTVLLAFLSGTGNKFLSGVQLVFSILFSFGLILFFLKKQFSFAVKRTIAKISIFSASVIAVEHTHTLGAIIAYRIANLFQFIRKTHFLSMTEMDIFGLILLICSILAVFVVFACFSYCFYNWLIAYFQKWKCIVSKKEQTFLFLMTFLFSCLIVLTFYMTNVFYHPVALYDLIYTSDTGALYHTNVWMILNNGENDIRQPLFALFSAPICVFPYVISKILFFVPNLYAYLLAIIQVFLMLFSFLTIAGITIVANRTERILLFLFLSTIFPTFLFALNMEQYTFALFYLTIFLHLHILSNELQQGKMFSLLAAAGSITTSWILLIPLWKRCHFVENIRFYIKTILLFLVLCITCFRINIIVNAYSSFMAVLNFSSLTNTGAKGCTFFERFCQFSNFLWSCFFAPISTVANSPGPYDVPATSYQLCICDSIHKYGCIIFAVAVIGYILNRKKKIAQMSLLWVVLSVLLLLICGYGAPENGMVLYTLYFSWAYVVLIYLALSSLLPKQKYIRYAALVCMIAVQLIVNIPAILDIIRFGIEYYPNK